MAAIIAGSYAAAPGGIMATGGYPTGAGAWPSAGRLIPGKARVVSRGQVHAHRMFIAQSPQLSKLRARLGKMATSESAVFWAGRRADTASRPRAGMSLDKSYRPGITVKIRTSGINGRNSGSE